MSTAPLASMSVKLCLLVFLSFCKLLPLVTAGNVLMLEDARMRMIYPNNVRSQTRSYGHIGDGDKLTQKKMQM